jgi:hypothetical protein
VDVEDRKKVILGFGTDQNIFPTYTGDTRLASTSSDHLVKVEKNRWGPWI